MERIDLITAYLKEEALDGQDVDLTPTTHLVEEGILDSLGIFGLVGFIEDRLGILIEPEDVTFDNFSSIATIEAFLADKQGS